MKTQFNTLGAMVDCSRNAVMNLEELKRFIQLLAKMGYNRLLLYMEDTYEVEHEELFGFLRGKYSIKELQELDAFAAESGVELVPCVQTLAHLNCICHWPRYKKMLDRDDILMVGDPNVYEFIDHLFASLRKSFKTNKIHIGMDEAHNLGKGRYRDEHGEREKCDILLEHLAKVSEIAARYDFEPMMWSDMFFRLANNGVYFAENTKFPKEIKDKVPQNVTLVYWTYGQIEEKFYRNMIKAHKQLSDKLMFAGGAWKWAGFVPHSELANLATKTALTACAKDGIKDVFITLWGDNGGETSVYSVLPALCIAACINRGIVDDDEIKSKFKEWIGADFDAFMTLWLPDKVEGYALNCHVNQSKYQLYNDCLMGIFDEGGIWEGDSQHYADVAVQLRAAKEKAGEYAYLFDTIIALCDVLEIKAELGIRTRKAYKAGDTAELRRIVEEYSEMIDRTETFYHAFRKQWYKENKPFGFEVQDIRLGGLIMRMKNCCNTLEEYLAGEISVIPELEETIIATMKQKGTCTPWNLMVTTNTL